MGYLQLFVLSHGPILWKPDKQEWILSFTTVRDDPESDAAAKSRFAPKSTPETQLVKQGSRHLYRVIRMIKTTRKQSVKGQGDGNRKERTLTRIPPSLGFHGRGTRHLGI
jgi:hypothetical protein